MNVGPLRKKWGLQAGESMSLARFEEFFNGMLTDFARLCPRYDIRSSGAPPITFPWKTTIKRFDDGTGNPLLWRADVSLGTVNDVPPPVLYLAQNDPRGWTPPVAPPPGTMIIERSMAEFVDPPWLLFAMNKPGRPPANTDQFVQVAGSARPDYFRTAAMWNFDLWQSSVFLTDNTVDSLTYDVPSYFLSRLSKQVRLTGRQMPVLSLGDVDGQLELARLYLLHDPADGDGSGDKILVRQMVFYCVRGELITPGTDNSIGVDPSLNEFAFWTA